MGWFMEGGLWGADHYVKGWFLYVKKTITLRRGGFLLCGYVHWGFIIFGTILEINYTKHTNLICLLWLVS